MALPPHQIHKTELLNDLVSSVFLKRIPEYPNTHIHGIPEDQTCIDELQSI